MDTMTLDPIYIADQSRLIRKILGWTQENLADAANLTTRTIEKIESGKQKRPSWQTLQQIGKATGFQPTVFHKPSPEEEKRQKEELLASMAKNLVIQTEPIGKAGDLYTRLGSFQAVMVDSSHIEVDDVLTLSAALADHFQDLADIWEDCTRSQQLEACELAAEWCLEIEGMGYQPMLGFFRQQHRQILEMYVRIVVISFLPKAQASKTPYAIVQASEGWQIPKEDRPKM